MKIGYLVPEFPGQTHIMFHREISALTRLGVSVDLVSTRRPRQLIGHEELEPLAARTAYLYPVGARTAGRAAVALVAAGPRRRREWVAAIRSAEGFPGVRGHLRLLALALLGACLAGVARQRRWTHLHVHSCADSANLAVFASCLAELTYSITLHGPLADYGGNQRQKWHRASFAIVITKLLRAAVEQQLAGALPPSVRVVGMGIDPSALVRTTAYRPWRPGEPARIVSCGRLNAAKGHVDVISAVSLLRSQGVGVDLSIAGEDDEAGTGYRRTLERHAERSGAGGAIRLLGAVPASGVRTLLETAHVFVLASLAEPLGVAIMEAMAMELPVVVTSGGGVPELVTDGQSGLLVPPGSPPAVAAAIRRVLEDPKLAVALGARARRSVIARFDVDRNAATLVEEIRRLDRAGSAGAESHDAPGGGAPRWPSGAPASPG